MTRPLVAALLAAVVALSAPSPADARKKARGGGSASAPAWLREAAALQLPGDLAGAATVLVHDELRVEPLASGGVRLSRRQAHRVLEPEGLVPAGALGFTYSEDDRLERATAWNLLPDGNVRVPHPDDDVLDVAWTQSGNLVDDTRFHQVTVPGCRVGSVVGQEWVVVRAIDTGAAIESYGNTHRPVGRCRIELRVPAGWDWDDLGERAEAFTRSEGERGVVWESPGFNGLERVEYPPAAAERLPRIAVRWFSPDGSRGFKDWAAVGSWYEGLTAGTLADAGESLRLAETFRPAEPALLEEALREAFLFCSRDVRYVSVQLGIGGFLPATPGRTCSNRYGDCKAKSFLMRSMVERWGLKSFPVLVRTSTAGALLESVPSAGQFNHCVVAIQLPEGVLPDAWNVLEVDGLGRLAILDATTSSLGPWQLRDDDQGTTALLVTPDGGRLVVLPTQPPDEASSLTALRLEVEPSGRVVQGALTWTATGTAAGSYRRGLAGEAEAELRRGYQALAQGFAPGSTLTEHLVAGLEAPEGPIELSLRFEGGRVGQRAGQLLIIDAMLSVAPVRSSVLAAGERAEPLHLGLPRERRAELELVAPAGWVPEGLPEAFVVDNAWFRIEGAWQPTETGYGFAGSGSLKVSEVAPAEYEAFREALRSASSAASEGVVLVPAGP